MCRERTVYYHGYGFSLLKRDIFPKSISSDSRQTMKNVFLSWAPNQAQPCLAMRIMQIYNIGWEGRSMQAAEEAPEP